MKTSTLVLGAMVVLGTTPAAAEENQATGDEIVRAARTGAPSDIASALQRGERTQCFACIGTVETLLYHDDVYVRQLAALWLRKRPMGFGPVMMRTRETLADTSEDVGVRADAAEALGNFADWHSVPALSTAAADDPSAQVRAAAVRALGQLDIPTGQDAIVGALADSDAGVRAAAVDAAMSLNGFSSHSEIVGLISDSDARVRYRAAVAVGELGIDEGAAALEGVVLTDENPWVRQNAAYALGVLGASDARETLEAAAEDTDRWVRSAARVALSMLR